MIACTNREGGGAVIAKQQTARCSAKSSITAPEGLRADPQCGGEPAAPSCTTRGAATPGSLMAVMSCRRASSNCAMAWPGSRCRSPMIAQAKLGAFLRGQGRAKWFAGAGTCWRWRRRAPEVGGGGPRCTCRRTPAAPGSVPLAQRAPQPPRLPAPFWQAGGSLLGVCHGTPDPLQLIGMLLQGRDSASAVGAQKGGTAQPLPKPCLQEIKHPIMQLPRRRLRCSSPNAKESGDSVELQLAGIAHSHWMQPMSVHAQR